MHRFILAAALVLAMPAQAAMTAADESAFLARSYPVTSGTSGPALEWHNALEAALHGNPDMAAAARALAPRFDATPEEIAALADLWIRFNVADHKAGDAMRGEFLKLAQSAGHRLIVVEVASAVLGDRYSCAPPETFRALVEGVPHDAVWRVVTATDCPLWKVAYAEMAPEESAALLAGFARSYDLSGAETLALYAYGASPDFAPHVAPKDRDAVRRQFEYLEIGKLIDFRSLKEATGYYERLSAADRAALVTGDYDETVDTIDGVTVDFEHFGIARLMRWNNHKPKGADAGDLSIALAIAYYGEGDLAKTRQYARPDLLAQGRLALDCWHGLDDIQNRKCPYRAGIGLEGRALLDQALNRPTDDPYDLFERYYVSSDDQVPGLRNIPSAALCRYFGTYAPDYAARIDVCAPGVHAFPVTADSTPKPAETDMHKLFMILARQTPGFEVRIAEFEAQLEARSAAPPSKGSPPPQPRAAKPPPPAPMALPFRVYAIPAKYLGAPPRLDRTFPKLPDGFEAIRITRSGRRVVVISLSQAYEQAGAAVGGGYWVHLSDDGGKSWRAPLYTGIIENAPYVVQEDSRLPLIGGDALNLAVGRRDPSAYFIYPVATVAPGAPKPGLYIHIPLAELMRDSDRDGLTDIAEQRLLLDPHNPDTDGDGIPDGADPMPNVPQQSAAAEDHKALIAVLQRFFHVPFGLASDPKPDPDDAWARVPPVMIAGNPADFTGLHPLIPVLVYDDADMVRRRATLDDFPISHVGTIVFNRAHDRGYVTIGAVAGWETDRLWRDAAGLWHSMLIAGMVS